MVRRGCVRSDEMKAKLAMQSAKDNAKGNAKNGVKNNAKAALKLLATKKAENDTLRAQGIGIDAALKPNAINTIALEVVGRIVTIVEDGNKAYAYASAERRVYVESFASMTGRGYGTRLIRDENGDTVTPMDMKKTFKWKCIESLYTTNSAVNMSEVEKRVHQLLFENRMSIWIRTEREVSNWPRMEVW